jgi:mono/diheme cytochrome c family protein
VIVKRVSLATLFATFVFFFVAIAIPPAVNSQNSVPPTVLNGRRIFTQSCAACHDTLGTAAKSGPGLKNYYRHQQRPTDTNVRAIIQQGKGRMPAFSTLNKSQIDDLIAYLKTL